MKAIILIFLSFYTFNGFNQNLPKSSSRYKTVERLVGHFNNSQFKKIKKEFSFLGKLIVSKRRLRNEFESIRLKNGTAEIVQVTSNLKNVYTVQLKMSDSPKSRVFWQVNFNQNDRVIGFGFGYPSFYYRKDSTKNNKSLSGLRQEIDQVIAKYIKNTPMYGFNGGIGVYLDTFKYEKAVGYRSVENEMLQNDESTLFHLASCTKPIISVGMHILAEKKQVNLDDPVSSFLGDFPYKEVTINHLLSHTSGIPDYQQYINKYIKKKDFIVNADILQLFIEHEIPLTFEPNARFSYSNTNYIILALLIEKISGESLKTFLEKEIFNPLKMKRTQLYNTRRYKRDILGNYANGYVYDYRQKAYAIPDSLEEYKYVVKQDRLYGDDNVSSTIADYNHFLNIFRNETSLLSEATISAIASKTQLSNGQSVGYGKGIMINSGAGYYKLMYHTGSWPGYLTFVMTIPELKLNVVVFSNNQYANYLHLADEIVSLSIR